MTVSVTMYLAGTDWEAEIDTREFDSLPRAGEVIVFHLMRYWARPDGFDVSGAECEVVAVQHHLYVDEKPDVHAYIEVAPRTDTDKQKLLRLYPHLAEEGGKAPESE